MNNLVSIDLGNTNPNVVIFEDQKRTSKVALSEFIKSWESNSETPIICSSVGDKEKLPADLKSLMIDPMESFKDGFFFDMPVHYSETLGADRLIQSYYIFKNSDLPCLLIDSGTFTTIDLIGKNGFLGGYITPGVHTFLDTFKMGADLPIVTLKHMNLDWDPDSLPRDTRDAMEESCHLYHQGMINHILKKYPVEKIFLSGGQTSYMARFLKDKNFEIACHLIHDAHLYLYNNYYKEKLQ